MTSSDGSTNVANVANGHMGGTKPIEQTYKIPGQNKNADPQVRGGQGGYVAMATFGHIRWLAAKIAANRRAAKPHPCPHCGRGDRAALVVTVNVDPEPGPHFTLWPTDDRTEIHHHTGWIHTEHKCPVNELDFGGAV